VTDRLDEMKRAIERDAKRASRGRKEDFLHALALIGSVGWPIAVLTAAGAIIGHTVDRRLGTGVAVTLALVFGGAVAGSVIAMRAVRTNGGGA
jgi:hypothetical protein